MLPKLSCQEHFQSPLSQSITYAKTISVLSVGWLCRWDCFWNAVYFIWSVFIVQDEGKLTWRRCTEETNRTLPVWPVCCIFNELSRWTVLLHRLGCLLSMQKINKMRHNISECWRLSDLTLVFFTNQRVQRQTTDLLLLKLLWRQTEINLTWANKCWSVF